MVLAARRGNAAAVSLDRSMSDTVLFELADRDAAEHLSRRLRLGWVQWLQERDGFWVVAAQLGSATGDLASLLREVESWLGERGLRELWFRVDGRTYLLDPRLRRSAPRVTA
jgi:hypothetical protein